MLLTYPVRLSFRSYSIWLCDVHTEWVGAASCPEMILSSSTTAEDISVDFLADDEPLIARFLIDYVAIRLVFQKPNDLFVRPIRCS